MSTLIESADRKAVDAEVARLSKVVADEKKSLDVRASSLCKVVDLRRQELCAGMDARIDQQRAIELLKSLVREKAEVVVGCTLASVMRAVKQALLSGLVVDRFKGEVDFIPRNRKIKVGGRDEWVRELHADPNYRGLIHYVANTGKMARPPFVETVFEGEQVSFAGEADSMTVRHVKDPLNPHRRAGDTTKIVGQYVRWYLQGGNVDHWLSWEEILEHGRKYSKQFRDAEGNGKRDSMWHKDPIKMGLKTLIRDAVNRDKVPISREDRGYILDQVKVERQEWVDASEFVDFEVVPEAAQIAAPQAAEAQHERAVEQSTQQAAAALPQPQKTAEQVYDEYIEQMLAAGAITDAGIVYDRYFGPDRIHAVEWEPQWADAAAKVWNDRKAAIRAAG